MQSKLRIVNFIKFFAIRLRLSNPWQYKVPLLMTIPYMVILIGAGFNKNSFGIVLASYAVIIGFAGFGYLSNDLGDRKKDLLINKPNAVVGLSTIQIAFLYLAFSILIVVPWVIMPWNWISVFLLCSQVLLFVLYSFAPFRLKERGWLGILADTGYAHVIPSILAAYTYFISIGSSLLNPVLFFSLLAIWQLTLGIRNILLHQLNDVDNDIHSNTKTLVLSVGLPRANRITKLLIVFEVVSLIFFLATITIYYQVPALFFTLPGYWLFKAYISNNSGHTQNYRGWAYVMLDDYYQLWMPTFVLVGLVNKDPIYWIIAVLHVIFLRSIIRDIIVRFVKYVRRRFYHQYEQNPIIGLVTTNLNKYSETFIHQHKRYLNGRICVLFDGYLPSKYSWDKGLTSNSIPTLNKKVDTNDLVAFITLNKINLLFCEYGPSGVMCLEAVKITKIPLIVHFHGYDAYRNDILTSYGNQYRSVFKYAKWIISVSEDMTAQLVSLGCPSSKLIKLVYGIDHTFFKPSQDIKKEFDFVFCGRFVPKKGTLYLLQAFKLVIGRFPNAKLLMIGDGEQLTECIDFIKFAGIESNVQFVGVLPPAELLIRFQQSKIFVIHSVTATDKDSEGTPLVVLEAMACELPVIATKHGGIKECIVHQKTGYLVDEYDVNAMANQMSELLTNEHLIQSMGHMARVSVLNNYDLRNNISNLNGLIMQALG